MPGPDLSHDDARRLRMRSLLLSGSPPVSTPLDVVEWFGAMQAQDHGSGLWSLGCRLPGRTRQDIEAAVERGEVLRTWPMRGTIHLVPPRDARWMLELTGARALAGAARRRETIGLSTQDADRGIEIIGEALRGGRRLVRAECVEVLRDAGVDASGQRGYHLLWYASQHGVTCIGPHRGTEQTFVRLDEWAPQQHRPSREEALATLAVRYVRGHGPVTRQDFAGWTGLPLGTVTEAVALAGAAVATARLDGREVWVDPGALDRTDPAHPAPSWRALSGFDEYMLGYKDRSLIGDAAALQAVVPGGNGVFRWTLVRDGRLAATWQRKAGTRSIAVAVTPVDGLSAADRRAAEAALAPYEHFAGLPLTVTWEPPPAA